MRTKRGSARRASLVALALLTSALVVATVVPAQAAPTTRTAPYDVGCVGRPPCAVSSADARQGKLHGTLAPYVCISYALAPVWPCLTQVTTTAGIRASTPVTRYLAVSAQVSDTTAAKVPTPLGLKACISALWPNGNGYVEYGCTPLARGTGTTIRTRFEFNRFPAGTYNLVVSLAGGTGTATVHRISYEFLKYRP